MTDDRASQFDPFAEPDESCSATELADQLTAEERAAAARASSIDAARRKGGVAGAALAGAMFAMRDIYEKPKEEIPIEVEASGEPHDLERDGVDLEVHGVDVTAPPLERKPPLPTAKSRRPR